MAEIKNDIIGSSNFLREAEYGMWIYNFLKDFEDKFLLAQNVLIHFEESINPNPNKPVPNELIVSEDGKTIKLIYKSSRFFQPRNALSKPSVSDFFSGLRYYMENVVIAEDNKRFKQLNNTQEQ